MCLFSGSLKSKLPYSSVLILVWLLGRVSIFLARMLTLFQQLPTMTACGVGREGGQQEYTNFTVPSFFVSFFMTLKVSIAKTSHDTSVSTYCTVVGNT